MVQSHHSHQTDKTPKFFFTFHKFLAVEIILVKNTQQQFHEAKVFFFYSMLYNISKSYIEIKMRQYGFILTADFASVILSHAVANSEGKKIKRMNHFSIKPNNSLWVLISGRKTKSHI